jgi:hypothetical protein
VSFAYVDGIPTLMVGSPGGSGNVRAYRYIVSAHGNIDSNWYKSYWVPHSTQGIELVVEGATEYLLASASEGLYKYPAELARAGKPPNYVIKYYPFLPVGVEDTARVGTTYWSASESGARYYQRRPFSEDSKPWTYFFPFIFTFQPSSMTYRTPQDTDFK